MNLSLFKNYKTGQLELQCDYQLAEPENGIFEEATVKKVLFKDTDITELIDEMNIWENIETIKNDLLTNLI